jgi:glutamyl-tRNA(Gln) amidotransferase subunit E
MEASRGITEPWLRQRLPLFGELDDSDYAAFGLKVGLEIHQQLMSLRKLFCRCPAGRYDTVNHDAEILRHMRPTLSEMGEYDGTALMEFKTRKNIVYLLNHDTVCTYEMDDAPPFEIDAVALDRALAVAMMLGCNIVGEVHITRKQYLDGSIPTGFQRTAIVGTDGDIPFRGRTVHIRQISIEEDSCREVADRGHLRTYRTDRLGMPLIETVTDPDMHTPEEAAAVGQVLRWLCRISGLVRTGPGAARQDVNVSVAGSTRIEVKGVPSLRAIPRLVHNEALRQRSLLAIQAELQKREVTAAALPERFWDVTAMVRGTDCRFVQDAVARGATVLAVPVPGFGGLLGVHTQPHTTFMKEISDRIRVVACLDELPNVLASTQEGASLASGEWEKIAKTCRARSGTPILVVWGPERDARTAAGEIILRAREAAVGVPSETRQALDDGTTGFERILPGPDRMYPDTDLPPIRIDDHRLAALREDLPERPWERSGRLTALGVGVDLAERLARHGAYELFLDLYELLDGSANLSATGLASLLLDRHCGRQPDAATAADWWRSIVVRIARSEIIPEAVYHSANEPVVAVSAPTDARRRFAAAWNALPHDGPEDPERREHWIMGHVMGALRGRIAGASVRAWVREESA